MLSSHFGYTDLLVNIETLCFNENRTRTFLGKEKVACTLSYTYLRATFMNRLFSLQEEACAQLSHGYPAIGAI